MPAQTQHQPAQTDLKVAGSGSAITPARARAMPDQTQAKRRNADAASRSRRVVGPSCLPFGPSPPAFRIDSDFVFSPYCDQGGIMKSPVLKLSGQITSRDPSLRHWVMPIMR